MITDTETQSSNDDEVAQRREYVFDMVEQLANMARKNGDEDIALVLSAVLVNRSARMRLRIEVEPNEPTDRLAG